MGDIKKIKAISLGIELYEQEVETENNKFSGQYLMGAQFVHTFGEVLASRIAMIALRMIQREYPGCADYLQIFNMRAQSFM